MSRFRNILFVLALALHGTSAYSDTPMVATDILPVHSLVSQVMNGVASPDLIIPPGASPHGYSLRPSEARNLAKADLVIWIGEELTPWLANPIETLANTAEQVKLFDLRDTLRLTQRKGVLLEHEQHQGDHDHPGAFDPHVWLDPVNAVVWLGVIAAKLTELDPGNAEIYHRNAEQGAKNITREMDRLSRMLAAQDRKGFVVLHDSFRYFEARFGLAAAAAVFESDAAKPGGKRIRTLLDFVQNQDESCIFSEPQLDNDLVALFAKEPHMQSFTLDPMGTRQKAGPDQYVSLIADIGQQFIRCFASQ